jgi:hypothetical protein
VFAVEFSHFSWWLSSPRRLGAAEELGGVGDCLRPLPVILWGVLHLPRRRSLNVALVNCSCRFVTLLVVDSCGALGELDDCRWLATESPSRGRHKQGLACWQAREPRDKSLSPCVDWDFIVTTTFECVGISLRVCLPPLHVGISSLHPTLYIWTLYSCVVVACVVVVVEVASLFT